MTEPGIASGRSSGWVRCVPAAVVALAAAVVTAHGLAEVAVAAHVPEPLAWVYPVITDGLALVAYTATNRLDGAGRRYAWTVVVVAAAVSGLAQAAYLASGALPEAAPALRAGVGAWPAIAAAVAAHLLHLLADTDATTQDVAITSETPVEPVEAVGAVAVALPEPPPAPTVIEEPAELAEETPAAVAATPDEADEVDPRVRDLAELLAAGCDVTGAQAAAIHAVSERTGRRLVADARRHLEQHPIHPRLALHLVEPAAAGGTA